MDYINPFWEYLMDGNPSCRLNNKMIQLKLCRVSR